MCQLSLHAACGILCMLTHGCLCFSPTAGQPTAPRNVKIQPGRTTLTVVWDQPDTDSTATYTVQIYRDQSTDTFTAQNPDVQYIGLAWNGNIYRAGSTPRYTFTTPTLTLSRGKWPTTSCQGILMRVMSPACHSGSCMRAQVRYSFQ